MEIRYKTIRDDRIYPCFDTQDFNSNIAITRYFGWKLTSNYKESINDTLAYYFKYEEEKNLPLLYHKIYLKYLQAKEYFLDKGVIVSNLRLKRVTKTIHETEEIIPWEEVIEAEGLE